MSVPLAWNNLTHNWRRLGVAVAGVGFAVFLMFIEMGFKHALIDSTIEVVNLMQCDLVAVSRARYALPARQRMDRQRLMQIRNHPAIVGAYPVYIENVFAVIKKVNENGYPIRVIAVNLDDQVFEHHVLERYRNLLRAPGTGIIDAKSKRKYGFAHHRPDDLRDFDVELANQRLQIVGAFQLGTDFAIDGNVLMSDENYAKFFPYSAEGADPLSRVDLGVIRIRSPGQQASTNNANLERIRQELNRMLPDDVEVYTQDEFMQRERDFWNHATPVGYIFTVGMIMGFIVGVIICYQIIYSDIEDHMSELATLKAMGYGNDFFVGFVIQEAVFLSVLGFLPGLLVSWGVFGLLANLTGLLLRLTWGRVAFVFCLTLMMCVASGCMAIRKVISMDPAELF